MKTRLPTVASKLQLKSSTLGYTFASLVLCSASVAAQAATYQQPTKPAYTLKIVTHGEDANRSDNMSEQSRQDNRRTDISMKTSVQTGVRTVTSESTKQIKVKVSEALNRSIRLKDGGVIWVSKDPASINPKLDVIGNSSVKIKDGKFVNPLTFSIKTNYAHFIDSWEMSVYRADDEQQTKALANFVGRDLKSGRTIKWNGKTSKGKALKAGDELTYVLKVRDAKGHIDETHARTLRVIGSGSQADRYNAKTNNQSTTQILENNLSHQTIPLYGSQVRIFGRDIANGNNIKINGESVSVSDGKFFIEKLLPDGNHKFDVAITDNAKQSYNKSLNVDLKGKYMFMVALADVTIGEGKVTGNLVTPSDGDKHLNGDIFVDGRLAFYLKGKIKGKYLVTAQMDTGTAPIENIFDNIHKKDPRSLFRRLDPDKYYPVYGDDSTLINDTDSQGKMYVRVDWDKSRALWGNYNTDLTGTELSSFNRSLYGAKLNHKSTQVTKSGDHKADVTMFASEAQSAFRHNQFVGTGGSLYYLKDTDIVDGSEKVWIEVRERGASDRAVKKVIMEEGRDYEIDDFQGRIILHRPLLQIVEQSGPSLVKDTPLDGNQVFLMVDYEYVPNNFDGNKATYGANGKIWINDHVAVGGTYAHENRSATEGNYDLKGVDVTLQKAKGTYIKGEFAKSESSQTQGSFLSDDGGLNFTPFSDNSSATNIKGNAYSVEARANLNEFSKKEGSIGAWYKNRDAGFSTSNLDNGVDTIDTGAEANVKINDKIDLSAKATLLDKKAVKKTTTASAQVDYKTNDKLTLSGELRHVQEDDKVDDTKDGKGLLGAFKVGYDLNKDVNLYAIAQGTISKSGAYEDNNLFTIGTKARINEKLEVNAELSSGDRGDAATLGATYNVNDGYQLYSSYTMSNDRIDNKRSTMTMGQRKTVSDQLTVFSEHQFTREKADSGVGHTFGADYKINKEVTATASLQTATLDKVAGQVDRDAFSVGLSYRKGKTDASTRLEYRRDKGIAENTEQWVTTNSIKHQLNPSLRLQGKFNYSETKDKLGNTRDAKFTEASLGFALRPVDNDRLNVLGRLTYLYDLQPLPQSTQPDEKSLIASIESSYQLDQKWEIGGKLAHKTGEVRVNRNTGLWSKNDASLAAVRLRYHLTKKWDAMAEYHWMNSKESQDTTHGAMISVDRHIGDNMKIGIGYNFTEFDDDLSNTTGTAKGWFVNLVGKY